jgi:hypothetical protein
MDDLHIKPGYGITSLAYMADNLQKFRSLCERAGIVNAYQQTGSIADLLKTVDAETDAYIGQAVRLIRALEKLMEVCDRQCGWNTPQRRAFIYFQKLFGALIEQILFSMEARSYDLAESRFLTWLAAMKATYVPVRQDFFSFINLGLDGEPKERVKRPDFLVYPFRSTRGVPAFLADLVDVGGPPVAIDVKAWTIRSDRTGAYITMDTFQCDAQVEFDRRLGARRSFWCIMPPNDGYEGVGILIDLASIMGIKNKRPVYLYDVPSFPLNLLRQMLRHRAEPKATGSPAGASVPIRQVRRPIDYTSPSSFPLEEIGLPEL